jgi:hypothetical protein
VVACTGSTGIKQWLAGQIPHFSFDLYCAVLPAGWSVVNMGYDYHAPGLHEHYHKGSTTIDVWEGNVCALSSNPCTSFYPDDYGAQVFGPLPGNMDGDATAKMWSNIAHTSNPKIFYVISGAGMTEAEFRAYSAAMHKIS